MMVSIYWLLFRLRCSCMCVRRDASCLDIRLRAPLRIQVRQELKKMDYNKSRINQLIKPHQADRPLRRLHWFSRGYYRAEIKNGDVFYHDLRFSRSDLWLDAEGDYIFSFRLLRNPDNPSQMIDFTQQTPNFVLSGERLSRFWRRIKGDDTVVKYDP